MRDDGGLNQGGSSAGGKMWLGSGYDLKVELTGWASELDVGYRKRS